MKKIASAVLALVLAFSMVAVCFAAEAPMSVKTDVPAAKVGDVVTVTVDVVANSNLGSLQFSLTYNPEEFEYVADTAKNGNVFGNASINADATPGKVLYVAATDDAVNAAGTLLTAKFKVLKTGASFGVEVEEAYDGNDEDITATLAEGVKGVTATVAEKKDEPTTKAPETTTKAPETTTKAPESTTKAPAKAETTTKAPAKAPSKIPATSEGSSVYLVVISAVTLLAIGGASVVITRKKRVK